MIQLKTFANPLTLTILDGVQSFVVTSRKLPFQSEIHDCFLPSHRFTVTALKHQKKCRTEIWFVNKYK